VSSGAFDGVKVFSATKVADRMRLGELITTWLRDHPEHKIVDKVVTQSSDDEYHCIAITLFWRTEPTTWIALVSKAEGPAHYAIEGHRRV
jgi:hypothetical protein